MHTPPLDYPGIESGLKTTNRPRRFSIRSVFRKVRRKVFSNKRFGNFLYWILKAIIFIFLIKLTWDVTPRLWDETYYIKQFQVPEKLAEQGISGETVIQRILYHIKDMDSAITQTNSVSFTHISNEFRLDISDGADLEYEGISYRALVNFFGDILNPKNIIKGNIVMTEKNMMCDITFPNPKHDFTVGLNDSLYLTDKIDLISAMAANKLVEQLSPVHYASYKFALRDYGATINVAERSLDNVSDDKEKSKLYYILAASLFEINEDDSVKTLLKKSIDLNSNEYYPLALLAYVHIERKEFEAAEEYLRSVEKFCRTSNNTLGDFYQLRGIYFEDIGDSDMAIEFYRKGITETDNVNCIGNLAAVYAAKKNYDSATKYFDEYRRMAVDRPFRNTMLYNSLGTVSKPKDAEKLFKEHTKTQDYKYGKFLNGLLLKDRKEYDSASMVFNEVLQIDSNFSEALFWLAYIKMERDQDYVSATKLLNRCLTQNGANFDIIRSLTWSQTIQGHIDEAIRKLRQYSFANDYHFLSDCGFAEVQRGNFLRAEYFYKMSDFLNGENMDNLLRYGKLKQAMNNPLQAVTYFNRILEIDSMHTEAAVEIAYSYSTMGRWLDAERFSEITAGKTGNARSSNILARKALNKNDEELAAKHYTDSYNLDSTNYEAARFLARVKTRNGQFASAVTWWSRYEKLIILNSTELSDYSVCLYQTGQFVKSSKYAVKAVNAHPDNCIALRILYLSIRAQKKNPYNDFELLNAFANSQCDLTQWLAEQDQKYQRGL